MIETLIDRLVQLNINIELIEEDKLRIHAADMEKIPGDLLAEIKLRKEDLTRYLREQVADDFEQIPAVEEQQDYPLSSAQRRLWVLSQIAQSNIAYNIPGAYVFEGALNQNALVYAFNALIARHESLRTVFREDETGRVRQYIHPAEETNFRLSYNDLRNTERKEEQIRSLLMDAATQPFDLSAGPLLRAGLYLVEDGQWLFIYSMHHIISDGWSMRILIRELLLLYNAYVQGMANPLSPLRIHYKDYATWQQEQQDTGMLQSHKAYWLSAFEGTLPLLELPADKARTAAGTYNGRTVRKLMNNDVAAGLKQLVQEQGCTLFMGVLAAVNALLYRYTQQEDIIIGSPIAGREHADLADQIGFYVNTLALRTRFSGTDSFKRLLAKIKKNTLDAYKHQDYPFDELVDALDLQPQKGRNLLFDVMIAWRHAGDNHRDTQQTLAGLKVKEYKDERAARVSKFDLIFDFAETEEGLQINIDYNNDLYHEETIERLADHLEQLLDVMIQRPDTAVSALDYLSQAEKQQLLFDFNDTAATYPYDKTVTALFEEQVRKSPLNTALVFEGTTLTYKTLNEYANQLGAYLRTTCQVRPNDLIGIRLERSEWVIITILGILKAGGAYVPIDPACPEERMAYMLKDSGCKLLIDEDKLQQFRAHEAQYAKHDLNGVNSPEDLAYVIYTSGSTGTPKGVMVTHKSIVRLVISPNYVDISPADNILNLSSVSFDGAVFDIFGALLNGASLVIPLKEAFLDSHLLAHIIEQHGISIFFITTALFNALADAVFLPFNKLRYVLFGGEQVSLAHVRKFRSCHTAVALVHVYGPTENTTFSSYYPVGHIDGNANTVPIGRAISNSQCYILNEYDQQLQLAPIGVIGEICVAGEGLALGYLNNPELTAAKFVANPFMQAALMYKTGDWGRWLADGSIEFTGRKDGQVKIRGYRIETGEIERALRRIAGIEDTVVIARPDDKEELQLVAYIVSGEQINIAALRQALTIQLPAYMVPGCFVQTERLPLTINGKIDKQQLPIPAWSQMHTGVEYEAPEDETAAKLVLIWQELLNKERIGVNDNFFELGAHSIKASRLINLLYRDFNVKISLKDIFARPVLKDLALLIAAAQRTSFMIIDPAPVAQDYPLSSVQQRLWILSQHDAGNAAYNIPGAYLFRGNLDLEAFERAFNTLIERHESLRTVFREDEAGRIRQYVYPATAMHFRISCEDLRNVEAQEHHINTITGAAASRPFDLSAGPLLRAGLYQLADQQWLFTYTMHHIISDGWSMQVLNREMLTLYNAYAAGLPDPLSPLRIHYKDYAVWQQSILGADTLQSLKNYWLSRFEGELPVLELLADKVRPPVKTYNGGIIHRTIHSATCRQLKLLVQEQGATLFMGLLAAVNALLYRYTSQEDIIIGSPVAGREHIDLADQIGCYLNTLALRMQFSGENSFRDLLALTRTVTLGAYEHQLYPFDELVTELPLKRDASRAPLFDVMVVLQNTDDGKEHTRLNDLQAGRYEEQVSPSAKFDLTFNFVEIAEALQLDIIYNSDIYNRETVEQLADHFRQLLDVALTQPSLPVKELDYLSAAEKQQLLVTFNDTAVSFPAGQTLVTLFEYQVQQVPDHMAVVYGTSALSYKALNEQANRLADYLKKSYGIEPDDLVGIKLKQSEWIPVAIMGVLKAGGAYVPVDPEYPVERVEYIASDTRWKILIDEQELERFVGTAQTYSPENPVPSIQPDNLAYVIYTSGTTGKPKGAMITHYNIVNYTSWFIQKHAVQHNEGSLLLSSITFDGVLTSLYGTLLSGSTLHVIGKEMLQSPVELCRYIHEQQVSFIKITPPLLKLLLAEEEGFDWFICAPRLRLILIGGEKIDGSDVKKIKEHNNTIEVVNHYGPTETTVGVTTKTIISGSYTNIPIGSPIFNTRAYILGSAGNLQPVGVAGELCIGGAGLARGYLNLPELTAERFLPDPFVAGERIYRTGDLARRLPDGNIELIGRNDDQVKIRGYRIELPEIEHVLRKHPGILSAVVLARENSNEEKDLVAYIVGKEGLNLSEMRPYLSSSLPAYMIPKYYVPLAAMPLTSHGKVDKRKLPSPESQGMETGVAYIAPANDMERHLVEVYEEVLKKHRVSVKDDFFVLGGDSIKSIQIVSRLKKRGYSITIGDILLHPVIEDLAGYVGITSRLARQEPVTGTIPLSPIQNAFFQRDPADKHHYNQSVLLYSPTLVSEEGLRAALDKMILHHDALRMVYRKTAAGWIQECCGTEQHYSLEIIPPSDEKSFTAHCERIQAGMDLEQGPLFKVALFRGAAGDRLLMVAHHLVIDGVSWRILFEDLSILYQQYLSGGLLTLPLKTDAFRDWQHNLLQYAESGALEKEDAYWEDIAALQVKPLPLDMPQGSNLVKDVASCSFTLDEHTTGQLLTRCYKAYRTEINDLLLTAAGLALAEVFKMDKVLVNLEGHGREPLGSDLDVSRTVGWFTSVYPVVLDMRYQEDMIRQLIEVKEHLHRVPRKGNRYGILRFLKGKQYNISPEITFNYLGDFGSGVNNGAGDQLFTFSADYHGREISANMQRPSLLDISGMVAAGCLRISISYSSKQYAAARMEALLTCFRERLTAMIERLSNEEGMHLSPVDLTFKGLSITQLEKLKKRL